MNTRCIAAAAIAGIAATSLAAPAAHAETAPLAGFFWALPDGTYLTDQSGHISGTWADVQAQFKAQGLYASCFTVPNYDTTARYSVTTGENPPNSDWTWRWSDIAARIADGRIDQAKHFSYTFTAGPEKAYSVDGKPQPGVLSECDLTAAPVVLEPGKDYNGGGEDLTPAPDVPTPREPSQPVCSEYVEHVPAVYGEVLNRVLDHYNYPVYTFQVDYYRDGKGLRYAADGKLTYREDRGSWGKSVWEFVTVSAKDVQRYGNLTNAINAKTKRVPNLGRDVIAWRLGNGATVAQPWGVKHTVPQIKWTAVQAPKPVAVYRDVVTHGVVHEAHDVVLHKCDEARELKIRQ